MNALHLASGTTHQTRTSEDGRFSFTGLPAGDYTLSASHIGYGEYSAELAVSGGSKAEIAITLVPEAVGLDPLVVAGTRSAQAEALQRKRLSTNIREVSLADDVGKLPYRNLADAISRLAGVSVEQGVGDARYVTIRGISPDLNQVNVNGQASAISDVDARAGRSGPLDVVGAGDFANIEVVKTLTPDMDAQGLGGQINVSTPSAFAQGRRFAFAQADYGANDTNGQDDYSFTFGLGDVLLSDRLGVYVGGGYSNRDFTFDRIEGDWSELDAQSSIPVRQELKLVDEVRERWSGSLNLEYSANERSSLYLRSVFNQVDDVGQRDEIESQLRGDIVLGSPTAGSTDEASVQLKTRVQDSRRRIANVTVGAEQFFGSRETILWEPTLTYSIASEDRDINFIESEMNDRVAGSFDASDYVYGITAHGRADEDNYHLRRIRYDGGLQDEDLFVVQNDVTWFVEGLDLFDRRATCGSKSARRRRYGTAR